MTPEKEHGISVDEIKHQCQRIDSIIGTAKSAQDQIYYSVEKVTNNLPDEILDKIDSELWTIKSETDNIASIEGELETLREKITTLREWGEQWKDKAIEYHKELSNINQEL